MQVQVKNGAEAHFVCTAASSEEPSGGLLKQVAHRRVLEVTVSVFKKTVVVISGCNTTYYPLKLAQVGSFDVLVCAHTYIHNTCMYICTYISASTLRCMHVHTHTHTRTHTCTLSRTYSVSYICISGGHSSPIWFCRGSGVHLVQHHSANQVTCAGGEPIGGAMFGCHSSRSPAHYTGGCSSRFLGS